MPSPVLVHALVARALLPTALSPTTGLAIAHLLQQLRWVHASWLGGCGRTARFGLVLLASIILAALSLLPLGRGEQRDCLKQVLEATILIGSRGVHLVSCQLLGRALQRGLGRLR